MNRIFGITAILIASLIWALEPTIAKLAYNNSSNFIQVLTSRSLFAALIAFIYCLVKTKRLSFFKIQKREFSALFVLTLINVLFADMLYFFAISKIPVVNAVLIAHLQPVFIIFLGYFLLKSEKTGKYDYLGVIFMIIAGLFVSTRSLDNLLTLNLGTFGDLLVLLATGGWATTTLFTKKYLSKFDSGLITFYRFGISSIFFLLYFAFNMQPIFNNWYQVLIGVLIGIGYILYYEALKHIKAVQVSALELTAPFFGAILGFLILKEVITRFQGLGMISLLFGVYFLSRKN